MILGGREGDRERGREGERETGSDGQRKRGSEGQRERGREGESVTQLWFPVPGDHASASMVLLLTSYPAAVVAPCNTVRVWRKGSARAIETHMDIVHE